MEPLRISREKLTSFKDDLPGHYDGGGKYCLITFKGGPACPAVQEVCIHRGASAGIEGKVRTVTRFEAGTGDPHAG